MEKIMRFLLWQHVIFVVMVIAMASPVLAQEAETISKAPAQDTSVLFAPDMCEFTVTFPDEPYKTRRCDPADSGNEDKCYDQISFTQVYDMSSTINLRVTCNEVGEDIRTAYSGDIMQATLKAMTHDSVIETFDTSFRETDRYKQAGLVGEGKMGKLPTIYVAQLWIGNRSAFSIEAELAGYQNDEAEMLFSNILKTVGHKDEITVRDTPLSQAQ